MYRITTDVFCNECGDWAPGVVSNRVKKGTAWAMAVEEGWRSKRSPVDGTRQHYCPACIKKMPPEDRPPLAP